MAITATCHSIKIYSKISKLDTICGVVPVQ